MKLSETWLQEWAHPKLTRDELCNMLTMGGFEVEEVAPVAADFSGIIIGQVVKIEKHPEADRLQVCEVDVGTSEHLRIVCGASNVTVGMKVPVAMIGAVLPDKTKIKPATLRGVPSQGMLCSANELAFSEENPDGGLLVLPIDAPLGVDMRDYLKLEDYTLDLSITPNRGDCLSVRGVAREVAALSQTPLTNISIAKVAPTNKDVLPVSLQATAECPRYLGRVIRGVKADAQTPVWLKERLRRSGTRSISPIVDVTNYVMLELGQPMHAFDLNKINEEIIVRLSNKGEKIALLDGTEKILDAKTLVIADKKQALAIAGVMGGVDSSVTLLTTDILLESAYFSPTTVAKQRQTYQLNSESASRFERGVDPTMQQEAIERATQLILEIAGGTAGPVIEKTSEKDLPTKAPIKLQKNKVTRVLGLEIAAADIEDIFKRLHFTVLNEDQTQWEVEVPPYRSDLVLPEDLIEELARLYHYDNIPTHPLISALQVPSNEDAGLFHNRLRQSLCDQGFHEIVSYSFVDKKLQALLEPDVLPIELVNPISADMSVMRTNLFPGLINTLLYNKSRQQHRVRLFEIGICFTRSGATILQQARLAGLVSGSAAKEQWGIPARDVDFFDLKANVTNVLELSYPSGELVFKPEPHLAMHPGQTAAIYHQDNRIGVIGALHPAVLQDLDLPPQTKVFAFELDLAALPATQPFHLSEVSKFPEIRRDLAIIVNQAVPAKAIQDTIRSIAGDWLKEVFIFDVYQGKGVSPGLKSIALGLVLQHPTRTLVDEEVTKLIDNVIDELKGQLKAELRS